MGHWRLACACVLLAVLCLCSWLNIRIQNQHIEQLSEVHAARTTSAPGFRCSWPHDATVLSSSISSSLLASGELPGLAMFRDSTDQPHAIRPPARSGNSQPDPSPTRHSPSHATLGDERRSTAPQLSAWAGVPRADALSRWPAWGLPGHTVLPSDGRCSATDERECGARAVDHARILHSHVAGGPSSIMRALRVFSPSPANLSATIRCLALLAVALCLTGVTLKQSSSQGTANALRLSALTDSTALCYTTAASIFIGLGFAWQIAPTPRQTPASCRTHLPERRWASRKHFGMPHTRAPLALGPLLHAALALLCSAALAAGQPTVTGSSNCSCPLSPTLLNPYCVGDSCLPCSASCGFWSGRYCVQLDPTGPTACFRNCCPRGTYSSTGLGMDCTSCPAGFESATSGDCDQSAGQCGAPCAAGVYCPGPPFPAIACPPGTFNPSEGATSSSACRVCPAGAFCSPVIQFPRDTGVIYPRPCPQGQWADAGSTECSDCPPGTYCTNGNDPYSQDNSTWTTTKSLCPPGTYSPQWQASSVASCVPCHSSTDQAEGATTCGYVRVLPIWPLILVPLLLASAGLVFYIFRRPLFALLDVYLSRWKQFRSSHWQWVLVIYWALHIGKLVSLHFTVMQQMVPFNYCGNDPYCGAPYCTAESGISTRHGLEACTVSNYFAIFVNTKCSCSATVLTTPVAFMYAVYLWTLLQVAAAFVACFMFCSRHIGDRACRVYAKSNPFSVLMYVLYVNYQVGPIQRLQAGICNKYAMGWIDFVIDLVLPILELCASITWYRTLLKYSDLEFLAGSSISFIVLTSVSVLGTLLVLKEFFDQPSSAAANSEGDHIDLAVTVGNTSSDAAAAKAAGSNNRRYPMSVTIPEHSHPLTMDANVYGDGAFKCDICKKHTDGVAYHCEPCQFDVHPRCAGVHPQSESGPHAMELANYQRNPSFALSAAPIVPLSSASTANHALSPSVVDVQLPESEYHHTQQVLASHALHSDEAEL